MCPALCRAKHSGDDPAAIPKFFVPILSMAHGKANPVISMATDAKFFLLLQLCEDGLSGNQGRLIYVDGDADGFGVNQFFGALLAFLDKDAQNGARNGLQTMISEVIFMDLPANERTCFAQHLLISYRQ